MILNAEFKYDSDLGSILKRFIITYNVPKDVRILKCDIKTPDNKVVLKLKSDHRKPLVELIGYLSNRVNSTPIRNQLKSLAKDLSPKQSYLNLSDKINLI